MVSSINSTFVSPGIRQAQEGFDQAANKISSAKRINSAADDAAGLAIATRFSSKIAGFDQAARNSADGISLAQTASGDINSINDNLGRIRELSLQASNGALSDSDRQALNSEATLLRDEITRIAESSNFNGISLLSQQDGVDFQVGTETGQTVNVATADLLAKLEESGLAELDISTQAGAQAAVTSADEFQAETLSAATDFGASINRFDSVINQLEGSKINAEASRSRIEDTDLARQSSELVKNQIMLQTSIAVQGQANQQAELVLRLLS